MLQTNNLKAEKGLFIDGRFTKILPRVEKEIPGWLKNFKKWNKVVSFGLNEFSFPYRDQQNVVIEEALKISWKTLLDDGAGEGRVIFELLSKDKEKRIIALDPDKEILKRGAQRTKIFSSSITFLLSSSFIPLPLEKNSLDLIISNLGGITYGSLYFEDEKLFLKKEALKKILKERKRVLKEGGHLIIGSLLPQPDFLRIKKETITYLFKTLNFRGLFYILKNRKEMMEASSFMTKYAEEGWAFYLFPQEWKEILLKEGFIVKKIRIGHYSEQGVVILAQKPS